MKKIIEMITDLPYKFKPVGSSDSTFLYKTDKSEHYIVIFEESNLIQMYANSTKEPNKGHLYNTGKINVTDHTLKILIASLILIPFRDEIYRPDFGPEGDTPLTDRALVKIGYLAETLQGQNLSKDELIENLKWLFDKRQK